MSDSAHSHASLMGIPMKHISLLTLTVQNSVLILIMHYSRIMPLVGGQRYLTSTAVFFNEVIKLAVCLSIALYDISRNLPPSLPATSLFTALYNAVFTRDSWKLAIPACFYTLQNSLQYVAISNLDAATFQVTYQLKILTAALFSVFILRRTLSTRKWLALILLTVGVALVQIPSSDAGNAPPLHDVQSKFLWPRSLNSISELGGLVVAPLTRRSATYEGIEEDHRLAHPQMNGTVGLVAVIVACIVSGLAGVYFEKVLKDSSGATSLWVRNVQMAFFSLFPAFFLGILMKDGEEVAEKGLLTGYNWVVWTVIAFQAFGGVAVALCLNYADNIAKNFATSISIVTSLFASIWFFDFEVTFTFLVGTSIVLFSTYLYSLEARQRTPPINIASFEKTTVEGETPSHYSDNSKHLLNLPQSTQGRSTSRPSSPVRQHSRANMGRTKFRDL